MGSAWRPVGPRRPAVNCNPPGWQRPFFSAWAGSGGGGPDSPNRPCRIPPWSTPRPAQGRAIPREWSAVSPLLQRPPPDASERRPCHCARQGPFFPPGRDPARLAPNLPTGLVGFPRGHLPGQPSETHPLRVVRCQPADAPPSAGRLGTRQTLVERPAYDREAHFGMARRATASLPLRRRHPLHNPNIPSPMTGQSPAHAYIVHGGCSGMSASPSIQPRVK